MKKFLVLVIVCVLAIASCSVVSVFANDAALSIEGGVKNANGVYEFAYGDAIKFKATSKTATDWVGIYHTSDVKDKIDATITTGTWVYLNTASASGAPGTDLVTDKVLTVGADWKSSPAEGISAVLDDSNQVKANADGESYTAIFFSEVSSDSYAEPLGKAGRIEFRVTSGSGQEPTGPDTAVAFPGVANMEAYSMSGIWMNDDGTAFSMAFNAAKAFKGFVYTAFGGDASATMRYDLYKYSNSIEESKEGAAVVSGTFEQVSNTAGVKILFDKTVDAGQYVLVLTKVSGDGYFVVSLEKGTEYTACEFPEGLEKLALPNTTPLDPYAEASLVMTGGLIFAGSADSSAYAKLGEVVNNNNNQNNNNNNNNQNNNNKPGNNSNTGDVGSYILLAAAILTVATVVVRRKQEN